MRDKENGELLWVMHSLEEQVSGLLTHEAKDLAGWHRSPSILFLFWLTIVLVKKTYFLILVRRWCRFFDEDCTIFLRLFLLLL